MVVYRSKKNGECKECSSTALSQYERKDLIRYTESIETYGRDHGKLGNVHLHLCSIDDALHQVGARHFTNARFQIAPGYILMSLSGLYDRLLSNDAFPLDFSDSEAGIINMPMPAHQLNGVLAL